MRNIALLLAAILLGGCASQSGVVDENFFDCTTPSNVSVDLVLNTPRVKIEETVDHLTAMVEVGNNGTTDIIVTAIRIEPSQEAEEEYRLERSYRKFDRVIAPGSDFAFELPVSGTRAARDPRGSRRLNPDDTISMNVSVYLSTGDAYRCEFSLPSPRV